MPRQPQVWAIRTKGWVELRKGAEPKLKVSKAVLETEQRQYHYARWDANDRFVEGGYRPVKRKVTLTTSIYTGGKPFQWVPYRRFSRLVGRLKDGGLLKVPVEKHKTLLG